jgi:uncharacterized repeat protein (TIGR03803 family)
MKRPALHLFCAAVLAVTLLSAIGARAGDTVLYNFAVPPDSNNSYSTPINDPYGNLYGTSSQGGVYGYGTVWVLCAPGVTGSDLYPCTTGLLSWKEFVLYNFKGLHPNDGANPYSTLVFNGLYAGRAFTLYGTTYNGGNPKSCSGTGMLIGCGTVFELCAPSNYGGCGGVNAWQEHVLHRFLGNRDGAHPFAGLITDKASDLFGTTVYGGGFGTCVPSGSGNQFCGTVFKLKGQSPWTFPETILHRFPGGLSDGANPYAALCCNTIYAIPYLYGTTLNAGANGVGVVFRVKNSGAYPEAILYNFCSVLGCPDGANPYANVIFDTSGNLYGTTAQGGSGGFGIAYKLTPTIIPPWTQTTLYPFAGAPLDGGNPTAGLLFDNSGNLYGTTLNAGTGCTTCGIVYELTPAGPPWTETILNDFLGGLGDGSQPWGGVTWDSPVSTTELYGATVNSGGNSEGAVYSVP